MLSSQSRFKQKKNYIKHDATDLHTDSYKYTDNILKKTNLLTNVFLSQK